MRPIAAVCTITMVASWKYCQSKVTDAATVTMMVAKVPMRQGGPAMVLAPIPKG